MKVAVVIPALDEAEALGGLLGALPRTSLARLIVVDGGSRDATAATARAGGAEVLALRRPGYGRACLAGLRRAASLGADVVVFLDAAGTSDPRDVDCVVAPIAAGDADLVIGSRVTGRAERGSLRPWQRLGNALATHIIGRRCGHHYTDLGPLRAVRVAAFERLRMREPAHGWPVEMQIEAIVRGLSVREVPVAYRRRRAGRSKVSGSLVGSLRAGLAILRVALGPRP